MKKRLFALALVFVACSEPPTDNDPDIEVKPADTLLVLPFSDSAQLDYAQAAYSLQTYSVQFEDFAQHSSGSVDSMHWPADLKVLGSPQSWNVLGSLKYLDPLNHGTFWVLTLWNSKVLPL